MIEEMDPFLVSLPLAFQEFDTNKPKMLIRLAKGRNKLGDQAQTLLDPFGLDHAAALAEELTRRAEAAEKAKKQAAIDQG